jgi:hypothetical protein
LADLPSAKWLGPGAVGWRAGEWAWGRWLVATGAFAAIGATAASSGAYFPTSWGWAALVFGWASAVAVVVRTNPRLSVLEIACLAAVWGLTGWIALSALWSESVSQTILETERALVYATALTAFLIAARRRDVPLLAGGVLAAIVVVSSYSLATRLFPERFAVGDAIAGNRLQQPLGYWNSLGTFAAIGLVLSVGFAARARPTIVRALAGAASPLLALTLYFTFGRGAWIALGVGLLVTLAADTRRLQLVTVLFALAGVSALAVWLASRQDALTSTSPTLAAASHQGHRFLPVAVGLCLLAGVCSSALVFAERRLARVQRGRVAYGTALALVAIVGAAAIVAVFGSPWSIVRDGYQQFTTAPSPINETGKVPEDLNRRLFSFSGSGRSVIWHVAWRDASEHPWLGSGAGTFQLAWLRDRPRPGQVLDAHSLYLETLAELGPAGLALLATALAVPLLAAIGARRRPLVTALVGGYAVYLVHAGADWDWEIVAVTLAALLLAAGLLVSARADWWPRRIAWPGRAAVLAVVLSAAAFAFVAMVGNTAVSQSRDAAAAGDVSRAESQARKAIRWAPWSSAGWRALGQVQLESGRLAEARTSLRRAIEKDPNDWSIWFALASASSGKERWTPARVALRLNPLSPELRQLAPVFGLSKNGE